MEVSTRTRADLKSYFVKNAIPTEDNFAELIEGMINQADDGLVKTAGNPLSIEAVGDTASPKRALNLYRDFDADTLDWTISLNPRINAQQPNTSRRLGFGISDKDENLALFIDRETGGVGIGTNETGDSALAIRRRGASHHVGITQGQVRGPYTMELTTADTTGKQATRLLFRGDMDNASVEFYRGKRGEEEQTLTIDGQGNVGIGTGDPKDKLDVHGALRFGGSNKRRVFGAARANNHDTVVLEGFWNELEVKGRVIDWTGTALHIGYENDHADHFIEMGRKVGHIRFMSGGGTDETMRITGGKVGIGTTDPNQKLTVDGFIASKPVFFSAYLDSNNRHNDIAVLPMQVKSQDWGNDFDLSSSTFTAPVTGVYLFTMTGYRVAIGGDETKMLHWYIMVNDQYANAGGSSSAESNERCMMTWRQGEYTTMSRSIILRLGQGARVYVRQTGTGRCDNFRSGLEGILICATPPSGFVIAPDFPVIDPGGPLEPLIPSDPVWPYPVIPGGG